MTVLIVGALGLVGCGSSSNNTTTPPNNNGGTDNGGSTKTGRTYVGVAVCEGCHKDIAEKEMATRHGHALATLQNIGQGTNDRCLKCHTVGFQDTAKAGYVNEETTPGLANVQCENCHGPGSEHAGSPSADNITRVVPSSVCGSCHTDAHHPTYDEWKLSKHSISSFDSHSDHCVSCHTAEGFLNKLDAPLSPHEPILNPRAETATTNDECWACHDPHEAKEGTVHQLRLPVNELCRSCHTFREDQGSTPSSETNQRPLHNPQAELINANGGFVYDPTANPTDPDRAYTRLTLDPAVGITHKEATEGDCSICHVYPISQGSPTEEMPNYTGHTFRPYLLACQNVGCHTNLARQEEPVKPLIEASAVTEGASDNTIAFFTSRKAIVSDRIKAVGAAVKKIDIDKLTAVENTALRVAQWNLRLVTADKSMGIHNWQYTNAMLAECERICGILPVKP